MGLFSVLAAAFTRSPSRHGRRPGDRRPERVFEPLPPVQSGPDTEPSGLHIEATPAVGVDLRGADGALDPRIARARARERQVSSAAEPEGRHARYEPPARRSRAASPDPEPDPPMPRRSGRFSDPELQAAYDSVFGGDGYGGMPTSYPEPPAENPPQ